MQLWSPSSRRAWIEIIKPPKGAALAAVALLAEGVDRNPATGSRRCSGRGRPPRGGRG